MIHGLSEINFIPYLDILVLTIFASLSGAEGYEAIEEFGRNK